MASKKRATTQSDTFITRYAFVDAGYKAGEDFAHNFLASGEFTIKELRALHPSAHQRSDKRGAAYEVANGLIRGTINADTILQTFVARPRHWAAVRVGRTTGKKPALGSAHDFLTQFGKPQWYGPVARNGKHYYVHAQKVDHYQATGDDEAPTHYRVRWHVVAEIDTDTISYHWHGFSHLDTPEHATNKSMGQFAYWKYMPSLIAELESALGLSLASPDLNGAVLGEIWDTYIGDESYAWKHLRIRAENEGVALNARSSGVKDLNIKGIQALTHALAKTATKTLTNRKDPAVVTTVEQALLRTVIHEWGTKSYEFSLDEGKSKKFRAHCYFGNRPAFEGPDTFAHLRCYEQYGGTYGAIAFLLPYLGAT